MLCAVLAAHGEASQGPGGEAVTQAGEAEAIRAAWLAVRGRLLAERRAEGYWEGELSSSALSTATATSALATISRERHAKLIDGGVRWLATHQNDDGGWGDTTDSPSNLATTMLSQAAIVIAGATGEVSETLRRADEWLTRRAGASAEERREAVSTFYGEDRTFAVPILINCALAGLVRWEDIPRLPFELAAIPQRWLHMVRVHVVSYALPALIAIGQLLHHRHPTRNPLVRAVRRATIESTLKKLEAIQPSSGGFIEAIPLTSFVAMSLADSGRRDHAVVRQAERFLLGTARADGSWAIDSNLSTWLTTQTVNALAVGPGAPGEFDPGPTLEWIAARQQQERHPFTATEPGGWGWTHLPGGVPDADDTASALLALRRWDDPRATDVARRGVVWLLGLQNSDGGWPTFCRGWGKLPFDRSAADLTAHAVRALSVWGSRCGKPAASGAIERGFGYLESVQEKDGAWRALWFGNQAAPGQENRVLGTARVLAAYRDFGRTEQAAAKSGVGYLLRAQWTDGGWGGAPGIVPSIEETAAAVESLADWPWDSDVKRAIQGGCRWLEAAVASRVIDRPSAIGLYFTKLWYSERLYPLIWTTGALGLAVSRMERVAAGGPAAAQRSGERV